MTDEEGTVTAAPKYPSIRYVPDYVGHWRGEAWFSGHPYGVQVHRSLGDAERWVKGRRAIGAEHAEDCVKCREAVDERHAYYPSGLPEDFTYRAFNGHMMTARVEGMRPDWSGYVYNSADAWHAHDCHCGGKESIPDY